MDFVATRLQSVDFHANESDMTIKVFLIGSFSFGLIPNVCKHRYVFVHNALWSTHILSSFHADESDMTSKVFSTELSGSLVRQADSLFVYN